MKKLAKILGLIVLTLALGCVLLTGCNILGGGKTPKPDDKGGTDDGGTAGNGDGTTTDHVHAWGEWVVTTPATLEATGIETRTCTLDATHKETRTIPRLMVLPLVLGELSVNSDVKSITWTAVEGATGYSVLVKMGATQVESTTVTTPAFSYAAYDAGDYSISVAAINQTQTSNTKTASFNVQQQVINPVQLAQPVVTREGNTYEWREVANASGNYNITIKLDKNDGNGAVIVRTYNDASSFFNQNMDRYMYTVSEAQSGRITFEIYAVGNGITTSNSTTKISSFNYVAQAAATYGDVVDVVLSKATPIIRARFGMQNADNFSVKAINIKNGDAIIRCTTSSGAKQLTVNLGDLSNFTDMNAVLNYVNGLNLDSNSVTNAMSLTRESITSQYLEGILNKSVGSSNYFGQNGITMDNVDYAYATNITNISGATEVQMTVLLNNGKAISFNASWNTTTNLSVDSVSSQMDKLSQNGINTFSITNSQNYTGLDSLQ